MSEPKPLLCTLDCLGLSFGKGGLPKGITSYCQLVWPDVAFLVSIGLLLAVAALAPMNQKSYSSAYRVVPMWTVDNGSTFHGPTELSYPYFKPLLSSEACAAVAIGFPILVIALFQVKLRSWWDLHRGVVGSLKAVLFAYVSYILLHESK